MDTELSGSTYRRVINIYGAPEIFNADQESQFTSKSYRTIGNEAGAESSMNGRGRALEN